MRRYCLPIWQLIVVVMFAGCISISHFEAWSGPPELQGKGGSFKTVDGIDVYSFGEPYKRYKVVGIIRNSTISNAGLMAVFGNSWATGSMVKEAKKRGGEAIILLRKNSDQWTTGSTDAMGNYQSTTDVNTETVVAVVKYLGDVKEQVLTPQVESLFLGHWMFVPSQDFPLHGQLDMFFLPNGRYKSVSTLISTNGRPLAPDGEQEHLGRYYFADNKLVMWKDKMDRPNPPVSFSITPEQLTINGNPALIVLKKQAQ